MKQMDDLISRKDAIDAAKHAWAKGLEPSQYIEIIQPAQPMLSESDRTICKIYLNDRDKFKTCNEYKMLMRLIDNSVHPKQGEWEYHSNPTIGINPETAYCSCCGLRVDTTDDIDFDEYNFCPRCGADMRTKETDYDYERAVEQLEHDMLYEPTFNPDDGSV